MDPSERPFTAFNFLVDITELDGGPIASMGFSEVSGMEVSMEPKMLREGGNNGQVFQLLGKAAYGQVTLKRGVSQDFGLWRWMDRVMTGMGKRAMTTITVLSSDRSQVQAQFQLTGCLPVKLRAPSLQAQNGGVAIEEMQLAYETLSLL